MIHCLLPTQRNRNQQSSVACLLIHNQLETFLKPLPSHQLPRSK